MDEERAAGRGLARRLSEITGVEIRVESETVIWTDGPTLRQMEKWVAEHLPPDVGVTYRRTFSVHAWAARAIAVQGVFTVDVSALRDLRRPDWRNLKPEQRLALDAVRQAVNETPYPDRADSSDHSEPIYQLVRAADHDKTRLAEILVSRVVDSSLNRRSFVPRASMVVYLNRNRSPFYCSGCSRTRNSLRYAVIGQDLNKVWCETCYWLR